jgi:hypothetical protein
VSGNVARSSGAGRIQCASYAGIADEAAASDSQAVSLLTGRLTCGCCCGKFGIITPGRFGILISAGLISVRRNEDDSEMEWRLLSRDVDYTPIRDRVPEHHPEGFAPTGINRWTR